MFFICKYQNLFTKNCIFISMDSDNVTIRDFSNDSFDLIENAINKEILKCPYCSGNKIRNYKKYSFCAKCSIFLKNSNKKFISSKFVPNSAVFLCKKCKENDQKILCNNFEEYYGKLKMCEYDKKIFKEDLKDLFFRHSSLFQIRKINFFSYFSKRNDYRKFFLYFLLVILGSIRNSPEIMLYAFIFSKIMHFNFFISIIELIVLVFFTEYFIFVSFIEFFKLCRIKNKKYEIPLLLSEKSDDLIRAFNKLSIRDESRKK